MNSQTDLSQEAANHTFEFAFLLVISTNKNRPFCSIDDFSVVDSTYSPFIFSQLSFGLPGFQWAKNQPAKRPTSVETPQP